MPFSIIRAASPGAEFGGGHGGAAGRRIFPPARVRKPVAAFGGKREEFNVNFMNIFFRVLSFIALRAFAASDGRCVSARAGAAVKLIAAALVLAFLLPAVCDIAFPESVSAASNGPATPGAAGRRNAFYSMKPADDAGIFQEISRYIDSLTIQIKNIGEFAERVSSHGPSAPADDDTAAVRLRAISAGLSRQKNDFELLYRDFVSLGVKNEVMKTVQSVKKNDTIEFDFKNANIVDISYEITLLESVVKAKAIECNSLDAEIASFSAAQDRLIDGIAGGSPIVPGNGDSLEAVLESLSEGGRNYGAYGVELVARAAEAYYKANQSRFLELKLFGLGRQKKVVNYELAAARADLDRKKRMNSFIKDNAQLFEANKKHSGLTTEEIQLSRADVAENKLRLDESLKKIEALTAEIKKEKSASESKADSWKLKFLNMSLQFEQELLKHNSSFSAETDELSKFLVRLANYSAKAAEEEIDNIQKLYLFTSGSPAVYERKKMLVEEIDEYKKQREEAASLIELIKSSRVKIENQIKVLNGELAAKDRESAEINLLAAGAASAARGRDADLKALRDSLGSVTRVVRLRLGGSEQHVQSAIKYEAWLKEKIKTIDNSIKVLSSILNQLEERLDSKTLSEAYSAVNRAVKKAYRRIENAPESVLKALATKSGWLALLAWFKNLTLTAGVALLAYAVIASLFFGGVSPAGGGFRGGAAQVLPYMFLAAAAKAYASFFMENAAMANILICSALALAVFKALLVWLHAAQASHSLEPDLFFRLSLFVKFMFFSTLALIAVDNASDSRHLAILAKFLYKSCGLVLAVFLAKKYAHAFLSYCYISRRRLRSLKYGSFFLHLASLYNHLLNKYHSLIAVLLVAASLVYFAGYYQHAFYVLNSSLLTIILYSILYLAPKLAVMTFEWLFSEESALLGLNSYDKFKKRAVVYLRIFYRLFFIVFFVFFTLKIWGISVQYIVELATAEITVTLGKKVVLVTAIVATGFLCWHLIERFIDDLFKSALSHQTSDNIKKRGATIAPLLKSTAKYLIWFLGIYLVLKEIGVDVTPIVAGAGIFALAVGFGAQNLVKDIVAGFFIIFEDQYNVGDYVTVEGISGTIEEISIRITKIRDLTGTLHIIPNGAITRTSNFSKDFSISRFEISVAYESDFDKAIKVIEKTASELCMDWNLFIIEPTKVLGIVNLGESDVVIRTQTKLAVGKKVDFECELRKRLLKSFRENGVEIPYKRMVVISDGKSAGAGTENHPAC